MLDDYVMHYADDYRKLSFKSLDNIDVKFLMWSLKRLKDTKNFTIILKKNEIDQIYDHKLTDKNFELAIRKAVWNITKQVSPPYKRKDNTIRTLPFFKESLIDLNEKSITLRFNEEFASLFLKINTNSNIDLDEMQYFKSKYSIIIYKYIKTHKDEGKFVIQDIGRFKNLLGIENQSNSFLVRKILNVIQREMIHTDLKNFKVTLHKNGKGGKTCKLKEIVFTWDK